MQNAVENIDHIQQIRFILDSLKEKNVYDCGEDGFSTDKSAVERIFDMTAIRSIGDILLRLTVIDSMYSTQMNRRYYALQELAEKLYCLNQKKALPELFKEFISNNRDASLFNGTIGGKNFNLFSEKYGIGKDGEDKGAAVSLISKYAYFETNYGFPIYDSIVCEMYPRIWTYCSFGKKDYTLTVKDKNQQMIGDETIVVYTKAIDNLIARLGGGITYDHFDRLLWFVGKIYRGNLSLVVGRENYEWCVKNWFEKDNAGKMKFDVSKVNIDEAPFCRNNPPLKAMFELAKTLKQQ
jgi:hypothetical protein